MGTPVFAVPSLECLVEHGYAPVAVVTSLEMPERRGSGTVPTPVKVAAQRLGLAPVLEPVSVKDPTFAAGIAALAPDVIVVVAFKILPPAVFTAARRGAFNLHGSLLPRYRGAAPINRAVLNGDTETGVTTFFLQERVDTGSIILQQRMPIGPDETAGDVHDRMMHLGAGAVLETIRRIEAGPVVTIAQDDTQATPAPKLFRDEGRIDWQQPAGRVHNHVRGFSPIPGAWTQGPGLGSTLKLYRTHLAEGSGAPGTVLQAGPRLVVACGEGAVEVLELQPEDRRRMETAAFLRGHPVQVGDRWA
jgi:methionyl-tRNA formyltransferase